jgi:hypothetical protein
MLDSSLVSSELEFDLRDAGTPEESNQGWFLPRAAPVLRAI